ncbi:MAG: hypothetical protein SV862_00130 [Pseudomonadota bacterium]|nr:hypothetical protein [Pseudomonadota bacterium]
MKDVTLSEKQAEVLEAFCEAFDLCTTGVWPVIAENMKDAGIADPDEALAEAREVLRG